MIEVRIPSTSANLGVLFDKGGVALDAYENIIRLESSDVFSIKTDGLGSGYLPENKENLIYRAIQYFYEQMGRPIPVFSIKTENGIPVSRGLGSSASCIAGGIYAANRFEGSILTDKEIIMMAADMEGHGDNVCAAVTGGFSIFTGNDYVTIPVGDDIGFILFIPEKQLSTKMSRGILPKSYDYKTKKRAKSLEQSMMKALYDMDYVKAGNLMELDVIHQPYRSKLLPFWNDVLSAAKEAGAWGTALSGAGPSMISMCSRIRIDAIIEKLKFSIDKRYKLSIIGCEININGIV